MVTAIAATALTVGAYYVAPVAECAQMAFSNRTLAIVVMWSVMVAVLTRKTYEQDRLWQAAEAPNRRRTMRRD
ncbi:hypothetical protein [Candidatus Nitrospira bockiana]